MSNFLQWTLFNIDKESFLVFMGSVWIDFAESMILIISIFQQKMITIILSLSLLYG